MAIIDDLTGLLAPDGPATSEFRQGVVTAISLAGNGTNTISVGGQFLTNIPFVSPADAINYTVGTVVLLLRVGASWCILGRPGLGGSGSGGSTGDSGGSAGSTFASGNYAPDIGAASGTPKVSGTLAVPVWANTASCIAILRSNANNGSASIGYLHTTVDIGGVTNHQGRNGAVGGTAGSAVAGQYAMSVASNTVANFAVTPGGSVTINGYAWATNPSGNVTWGAAGSVSEMTVDVLATYNRV